MLNKAASGLTVMQVYYNPDWITSFFQIAACTSNPGYLCYFYWLCKLYYTIHVNLLVTLE